MDPAARAAVAAAAVGERPRPADPPPAARRCATRRSGPAGRAARAGEDLGGRPFLYLIQEYEPFTFPMGSHAALAEQSYRFEHFALFSSETLRGYFRRHRIGVYEHDVDAGDAASASFQNAITPV